jgi:hypothetical protein
VRIAVLVVLAAGFASAGCATGDDPEWVAGERNGRPVRQDEFVLARGPKGCD